MLEPIKTLTTLVSDHLDKPVTEKQVKRYLQMTATAVHMIVDDPDMWTPIVYYTLFDNTIAHYIYDAFPKRINMITLDEMFDTLPYIPDSKSPEPSIEVKAIMLCLAERFIFEIRATNALINNVKKDPSDD